MFVVLPHLNYYLQYMYQHLSRYCDRVTYRMNAIIYMNNVQALQLPCIFIILMLLFVK